jgi:hypothetical protein
MNLTDLRDELYDRSLPRPDLVGTIRLASVSHRVREMRRRRMLAGGATLVVILVVVTGYGVSARPPVVSPGVNWAAADIAQFPLYAWGAHLTDSAVLSPPAGEIGLRGTATTLGFTVVQQCELPGADSVTVQWRVDGRPFAGFACDRRPRHYQLVGADMADLSIDAGTMVRFSAQIETDADLSQGTFAAALMQRVPFAQYPLPPRPKVLAPLTGLPEAKDPAGTLVESDPADPNAARIATVTRPGAIGVSLAAQTPGTVRVVLNGVTICTAEWWDFACDPYGCPTPTSTVTEKETVTFVPEHFTGAWRAVIVPQ